VARMGEKSVQGFYGKRPLGRLRRRWEDGIEWMIGRLAEGGGGGGVEHLAPDPDR
jgi:hypothetical protein